MLVQFEECARHICETAARMVAQGLTGALEGNISVRFGNSSLLCTPAGIPKYRLQPGQIVEVDLEGRSISGGTPTSELSLHLAIYRRRPDCLAIVHAHPLHATAHAWSHTLPRIDLAPEALMVLGKIALVPYYSPGTTDADRAIELFANNHKTFLLANHGAVCLGNSIEDAYCRMEILERVCHVGRLAGDKAVALTATEFARLESEYGHGRLSANGL